MDIFHIRFQPIILIKLIFLPLPIPGQKLRLK